MAAILLLLTGCSSYEGMEAFHREATSEDELPPEIKLGPEGDPSRDNFRLLSEHEGVKYYAGESDNFLTACLVVFPEDKPTQWIASCSQGVTGQREILTATGPDGSTTKLVTTGFDTKGLEAAGWRKIHENVLVGS
ncbi:hypothetical protein [Arthrobacter sp. ISL-30]|uniref:hypothetical protein n=1 Tax=Arthrobacter sp. ISL-30 TaxID=2819109 RepID=UPI001BE944BF|nr:hypothetical protein [Arthrobacter sp. ISL-30]MBT2514966.1 hypothetical protein [Arthrobacter sp. ISL-30]